jgi:P-type E1-E2 ATPase
MTRRGPLSLCTPLPASAGKWQKIDAVVLVPGDCVLLASGSAVPADCIVNHGQIDVDQSALTGESLPVTMYQGDSCKMGSTVTRGEVEGTVEVRCAPGPSECAGRAAGGCCAA